LATDRDLPQFRCFFFDGSGRICGYQQLSCATDAGAIEMATDYAATRLKDVARFEVWERARLVHAGQTDANADQLKFA
jgi:hypothetical protein